MISARCTRHRPLWATISGWLVAPPRQRVGPLAGVAELVCVAAEGDRVAVDDAGDDRRQLPGSGDHQGLVDQPQSVLDSPLPEQRAALLVAGQPDQIRVAESLADRGRLGRGGVAGLPVAARHLLQPDGDQQPAPFDAVALVSRRAAAAHGRTNPAREPSRRGTACCGRSRTRIARRATSRRSPGAVDAPAPSRRHSRHRGRACMPTRANSSRSSAPSPAAFSAAESASYASSHACSA